MQYKVKLYIHNSVTTPIDDDFTKCKSFFLANNIDVIFDQEKTEVPKYNVPIQLYSINEGKYDVVMYVYQRGVFQETTAGLAFNISPSLRGVYCSVSDADDRVDYHWKFFAHELVHTLFYKFGIYGLDPMDSMYVPSLKKSMPYYKNEEPDAPDGNFAEAWKRLTPYLKIEQPKYKYFRLDEKTGSEGTVADLKPELVAKLDLAREYAGIPFVITSGKRSESLNEDVGGVADSSHISGEAVDIRARNSTEHFLNTYGLMMAGFKRISKKYATHIHVDLSKDKAQNVLF